MPGMREAMDVQPDLPGMLRAAGGVDPAEQAARGGDAGGNRAVSGRTEAGGDLGGHAQSVEFVIPGTPVGKGRPKFARRGNFVAAYTPEKTASYENLVKLAAANAVSRPFHGPLFVAINAVLSVPSSWSKKRTTAALAGFVRPTSRPDVDNYAKAILDACNGIVWADDSQVVDLCVTKRYGESAHVSVGVAQL